MATLFSIENLEKTIGSRVLFEGLSLHAQDADKIGLIGPNGSGKSTLLKILAGEQDADAGDVIWRSGIRIGYVSQIDDLRPEDTLLEAALSVLDTETHLSALEKETAVGIHLGKLGFEDLTRPVASLSGGWRKRLCIARQLAKEPDCLLLDEPTNHLDLEGIVWLEAFLKQLSKPFVLISHDRTFLENVVNRMVELNPAFENGVLSFPCAYEEFMRRRNDYLESERARFESLKNKNRQEQAWVNSGVKARGTKQRSRLNAAAELYEELAQKRAQVAEPTKLHLQFDETERKTKRLIVAHNLHKSYPNQKIVEGFEYTLTPGMRVGLIGRNGVGKTTLMNLLAGSEKPDSGKVSIPAGISILQFDQNRQLVDENEPLRTALSLSGTDQVIYRGKPMHVSGWARKLKFRTEQLETPVGSLSGGERARVIMGRLMLQTADVLFLDEPTNDLDIPSIEVLEESLLQFPGALIFTTHDRMLLSRVATHILALEGAGRVEKIASYAQWESLQRADEPVKEKPKALDAKRADKKATKLTYNEQREWDMMEEKILDAETEVSLLEENAVSPEEGDHFTRYCIALAEAQAAVENLYARWAALEEKQQALAQNKNSPL